MLKKIYITAFILVLGFLLMPNESHACGGKCKMMNKTEHQKKKPKKDTCHKSNTQSCQHKNCGGRCQDPSCHCPSVQIYFIPTFSTCFSEQNTFLIPEKHTFQELKTILPAGFYTLWLLPKINA